VALRYDLVQLTALGITCLSDQGMAEKSSRERVAGGAAVGNDATDGALSSPSFAPVRAAARGLRRMRAHGGEMERLVHVPVAGLFTVSSVRRSAVKENTGSSGVNAGVNASVNSGSSNGAEAGGLVFGHYRAGTFALIRAALGVNDADFAAAFRAIQVPLAPDSAGGAPRGHVAGAGPGAQGGGAAMAGGLAGGSDGQSVAMSRRQGHPKIEQGAGAPAGVAMGCLQGHTKIEQGMGGSGGLAEVASSGASGSYFYFTPCKRFVVKTISRREKERCVAVWAVGTRESGLARVG
jgi:hypothetical protein